MPGTISFDGLATGINTTETVDKLIEVESRPKILKEAEKARLENQLTAWQEVNSKLLDLRTQAQEIWKSSTWATLTATSSNESILTATASADAQAGTYTVEVTQLARAHQISTGGYASDLDTVGTGTLTVTVGAKSAEITVDASNNTLRGLADAINQADVGATASVIYDGSQYRLLVTSDETGTANTVSLAASGFTLTTSTVQDAQDAQIRFGSGAGAITITSSSNQIDDVIPGVTLNLVNASPGTQVTVSMSRDTSDVEEKIQAFMDAYNTAMGFIGEQFDFDPQKNQGGILMGDRTLLTIQTRIQSIVSSPVATGGDFTSLRSVGLELDDDGLLSFDASKFQEAVAQDPDAVKNLFRTSGRTEHAKVSFVYAGKDTVEPASSGYSVVITQAAERAAVTGASAVGSLTIDATNDTLTLALDGAGSFTVTLEHKTYTSVADLAAEIQAKANAAAPDGTELAVSESGGMLTLTSQRYGSASKVELVGGNALANLGFTAGDSDTGVDVAGTINGESATGTGQTLTGDKGNPKTSGVVLKVELTAADLAAAGGSVTTTLHFAKGVGNQFDEYLQGLTQPLIGTIGMKQTALEDSIDSMAEYIAELEERLDQRRESLLGQFYRMEQAVNEFNSQGNYLVNALSGLNANWKWNG
ncbi:flagellar filament capping protein FliD [Deferrisoma palaeochoriense]